MRPHRFAVILGLAITLMTGVGFAQQPPPSQPQQGLPPGHPPVEVPGAQPRPPVQQVPQRPRGVPVGRPIGPGGQPFPPGHSFPQPGPGGRRPITLPVPTPEESTAHAAEHCPGHGPDDPPAHINWWQGLIWVDNERAQSDSFVNKLLFRYHNDKDACDPKNQPPPFLANILNFGLLAFVLYRFGRKPLSQALVKRKQDIMREIDNANKLREDAQARLTECQDKFQKLEETLAELKAEYAAQAEVDKKDMLAKMEETRARMRRDAEFRIEQEFKAARIALLEEAVQGAVASAETLLQQRTTAQDIERFSDDYLKELPKALKSVQSSSSGAAV